MSAILDRRAARHGEPRDLGADPDGPLDAPAVLGRVLGPAPDSPRVIAIPPGEAPPAWPEPMGRIPDTSLVVACPAHGVAAGAPCFPQPRRQEHGGGGARVSASTSSGGGAGGGGSAIVLHAWPEGAMPQPGHDTYGYDGPIALPVLTPADDAAFKARCLAAIDREALRSLRVPVPAMTKPLVGEAPTGAPKPCTCLGGPCDGACGYDAAAWEAWEAERCPAACPSGPASLPVLDAPRTEAHAIDHEALRILHGGASLHGPATIPADLRPPLPRAKGEP